MKLNSQLQKKMAKKQVCFLQVIPLKNAVKCNDFSAFVDFNSDLFSPNYGRLKTYLNEKHSSTSKVLNDYGLQRFNAMHAFLFGTYIADISQDFNYLIKIGFLHKTNFDRDRIQGIGNPFRFHLNEPRWTLAKDLNNAARDAIKLANEFSADLEVIQDCDLPF